MKSKQETYDYLCGKIMAFPKENFRKHFEDLFVHYNFCYEQLCKDTTLNWEHIKELSQDSLCTIGSHTVTHPKLATLNAEKITYELSQSKIILEKHLGKEVEHFCYPFGSRNDLVLEKVGEVGYKTAMLVNKKRRSQFKYNVYELQRIDIQSKLRQIKGKK